MRFEGLLPTLSQRRFHVVGSAMRTAVAVVRQSNLVQLFACRGRVLPGDAGTAKLVLRQADGAGDGGIYLKSCGARLDGGFARSHAKSRHSGRDAIADIENLSENVPTQAR